MPRVKKTLLGSSTASPTRPTQIRKKRPWKEDFPLGQGEEVKEENRIDNYTKLRKSTLINTPNATYTTVALKKHHLVEKGALVSEVTVENKKTLVIYGLDVMQTRPRALKYVLSEIIESSMKEDPVDQIIDGETGAILAEDRKAHYGLTMRLLKDIPASDQNTVRMVCVLYLLSKGDEESVKLADLFLNNTVNISIAREEPFIWISFPQAQGAKKDKGKNKSSGLDSEVINFLQNSLAGTAKKVSNTSDMKSFDVALGAKALKERVSHRTSSSDDSDDNGSTSDDLTEFRHRFLTEYYE